MSFAGAIADARKSATRLYINNFTDKARQNTTDILLVRCLHLPFREQNKANKGKRGDLWIKCLFSSMTISTTTLQLS